ncbi:tetratricopeptide repeat protein [Flavobacterium sp.]|jgi:tetratricopeptide (TPR) repeat protein|uniref:tetratricopeptide repeat protein n=1 Tax=Flavobacterium sp. TaxID=239 RepID=UPI0037C05312
MNTNDYINLLNNSKAINDKQTLVLETIVNEFPFYQSARALYLKGLYNQESFRYNYELKKTAAHTTDRSVLFDFITSDDFKIFQQEVYDKYQAEIQSIIVSDFEYVEEEKKPFTLDTKSKSSHVTETISISEQKESNKEVEAALEIGKPFQFEKNETHSFSEWLQLAKITPIVREEAEKQISVSSELEKKFDLIEKFIELNPKIPQAKDTTSIPINIAKSNETPSSIMTETLAQIYLEQKKYTKAIQAYEILILKYPEKSSFFADRIKNIKILQQNN